MSRRTAPDFRDRLIRPMSCLHRCDTSGSSHLLATSSCGSTPGPRASISAAAASRASAPGAASATSSLEMSPAASGGSTSFSSPSTLTVTPFACQ